MSEPYTAASHDRFERFRRPSARRTGGVGPTRFSTILPDVATFAEQGYNLDFLRGNFGVFVPAGVSRAIVQSLNGEVNRLLAQPAFVEKYIAVLGMDPAGGTPEDYAAFLKNDRNTAARVAKAANLKPE